MPIEIAKMEEARQARAMAEIAPVHEHIMGGVMTYMEPGSWSNYACNLGMDGPVTGDDLDRLVRFYVERGAEPEVEVASFADKTLIDGLAKRGFELRGFEVVLAKQFESGEDLSSLIQGGWPKDDNGQELVVERVDPDDEAMVQESCRVAMSGFVPAGYEASEKELAMHRKIVAHPHGDFIVAKFGSTVVGAGGAEYPRCEVMPVGVLFGVTVLEPWRRLGVQQAMIVHRLERARAKGAKIAVIHGEPGASTDRNAMRMGFAPAYTKAIMAMRGEGLVASR
ncbi:MAG: hypothetical protein COB69_02480 [Phycisphaera sp.]|nr:MAG: hypothetical protein COB69_02480 [Phycisphaera sp.]